MSGDPRGEGSIGLQVPFPPSTDDCPPGVRAGCYSLVAPDAQCGPKCGQHVAVLAANFRRYASFRPSRDCEVSDLDMEIEGRKESFTQFDRPLSILQLPRTLEGYDRAIGAKSANMIRKARRAGYSAGPLEGDAWLQDIFEVRTSTPERRGYPIPDYWKQPARPPISNAGLCAKHCETFYGVLQEGRLRAYCSLRIFGEIAQVNHILGHFDHLRHGIMNLMMREVVDSLLSDHPVVRGINYLYPSSDTLGRSKMGLGFRPCWTLITLAPPSVAQRVEQAMVLKLRQSTKQPEAASPDQHRSRPELQDGLLWGGRLFLGSAEALPWPVLRESFGLPEEPRMLCVVQHLKSMQLLDGCGPSYTRVVASLTENGGAGPFDLLLLRLGPGETRQVLGKALSACASLLSPRGWLCLRLTWRPARAVADGHIDETEAVALSAFFKKRFRREEPAPDDFMRGFRGSDFQYRGLLDDAGSEIESHGTGWLILRKVR